VKALFSILLGLTLLTSLVGISYATPVMQPAQSSGDINACVNLKPNDPNYIALGCAGAAHQNGNENPPQAHCVVDGKAPDFACCGAGQKADTNCCVEGFTPHSLEVSDIQADVPNCGSG